MRHAITAAAICLTACAGPGPGSQMQTDCEARHAAFAPMFECTRDAVAAKRPDLLGNPRVKLYLLRGEQLAARVASGALTDLDAKVEWQRTYVELSEAQQAEVTRALSAMPRPAAPASCTAVTTYGVTNTTCR